MPGPAMRRGKPTEAARVTSSTPWRIASGEVSSGSRENSHAQSASSDPVKPGFSQYAVTPPATRDDPGGRLRGSTTEGSLPFLQVASAVLAGIERIAAAGCVGVIFALLVLNIVTRSAGYALFWVDEAAVTAMVWMAFFAASVTLHKRGNIAVTFVIDLCPPTARCVLAVLVDLTLLAFVLVLAWLVWGWFAPLQLVAAHGDPAVFAAATMNFIYDEPTLTLGIRKAWVWLIVPLFALCSLIHCIANLDRSVTALVQRENG